MTEDIKKTFKIFGERITVGDLVEYKGKSLVFRGYLNSKSSNFPGLYVSKETKKLVIIKKANFDASLLEMLREDPIKQKSSARIEEASPTVVSTVPGRLSSDEILYFEIHEKDDDMVKVLKDAINQARVTVRDACDSISGGYNLVYGLRKRHSVKFDSLEKWCKFLRLKINLSLTPVERK